MKRILGWLGIAAIAAAVLVTLLVEIAITAFQKLVYGRVIA